MHRLVAIAMWLLIPFVYIGGAVNWLLKHFFAIWKILCGFLGVCLLITLIKENGGLNGIMSLTFLDVFGLIAYMAFFIGILRLLGWILGFVVGPFMDIWNKILDTFQKLKDYRN